MISISKEQTLMVKILSAVAIIHIHSGNFQCNWSSFKLGNGPVRAG